MIEPGKELKVSPWQLPVGLLISVAFLYLAAHNLSWDAFFGNLRRVNLGSIGLAAMITAVAYVLRGFRWMLFFQKTERPSWLDSMRVMLVGYAGNNILPARAGELLRAHYMAQRMGMSRSRVLATIVLERAFDALALVALLIIALPVVGRRIPHLEGVAWLGVCLLLMLIALFVAWEVRGRRRDTSAPPVAGFVGRMLRRADDFVGGLHTLGSHMTLLGISGLSLAIWTLDALSFWQTMRAFPVAVPWDAALAVCVFGNIGTMIPAGPGAVGTFEFAVVAVLKPWGYDASVSMGMAVMIHLLQFLLTTGAGFISWLTLTRAVRIKEYPKAGRMGGGFAAGRRSGGA
ncbi:MAG: flippase-like domain-containing protein [Armatimonadetes bacterium]|nr:flippase-like domain-containing protein [Armatimonadota bacterium]